MTDKPTDPAEALLEELADPMEQWLDTWSRHGDEARDKCLEIIRRHLADAKLNAAAEEQSKCIDDAAMAICDVVASPKITNEFSVRLGNLLGRRPLR